ncbi:MAG: hydroxymethylbilane synthase [Phycisphaerales bacterium]
MTSPEIILAAHGNHDQAPVNAVINSFADRVAKRTGRAVAAAFNQGTPTFSQSAATAGASPVVVPVMTSDGYFVRRKLIPAFIDARQGAVVTPPIGLDPRLQQEVAQRAVAAALTAPTTGGLIVVIGHGTTQHATSSSTTRQVLRLIIERLRHAGLAWQATDAYLDQPPLIEHIARDIRVPLILAPWLIGGGGHDANDITERLGLSTPQPRNRWTWRAGQPIRVLPSLLDAELVSPAIDRALHAADTRFPLRLATRTSRLAIWQAERAQRALLASGVPTTLIPIEPEADRDLSLPATIPGMFTEELTHAIADGRADAAVHSLKDLPLPTEASPFGIAALIERDSPREALIAREGCTLDDLPPGATVGTSSPRRAAQVRCLRPDLRPLPIRGSVEHRVAQVLDGRFDAAILAEAGLCRLGIEHRITQHFDTESFTPEPGQGIIALQTRTADHFATVLLSRIDHDATKRCATAERSFARLIDPSSGIACAAAATDSGTGSITLTVRLASAGRVTPAVSVRGTDPTTVARRAADEVERHQPEESLV